MESESKVGDVLLIYNVIADLCAFVLSHCQDEEVFVRYSCIAPLSKKELLAQISGAIEELFLKRNDGSLVIRQLTEEDLSQKFYQKLLSFIAVVCHQQNFFLIVCLLQVLDEALMTLLRNKVSAFQQTDFTVVLNTNRESTGIGLLPRCFCVWERRHRLSHSYNRLDNFLFHLLLLENTILGDLIDKHYFLKPEMFPRFAEQNKLRIAVSPLRLDRHFEPEVFEQQQVRYFRIAYAHGEFQRDNELIWQKIRQAAERQSDIVVFPELLGNPLTPDFISQRLKALHHDEREWMPSLMILPSYYENHLNTAVILDREGRVICKQSKQNPFRNEQKDGACLEAIKTNQVVNILHYHGIGRIAVLICKDFLTTSYMERLMRCFKLTLIIVPSFSTGSYDFRQSFDLCAHDDCNVIWINTCAALTEGKESNFENIGYVRKRIGRGDDDSQKLCRMPICQGAFHGECSRDCIYFETIRGV